MDKMKSVDIMNNGNISLEKYQDSLSLANKLHRLLWNICCLVFFRPFGYVRYTS